MSAFIAPFFGAGWQGFTDQGIVLAGGKLYTYVAGSTTAQATWTTSTQAVQNANPIILSSNGRSANEIWLQSGLSYKFVLTDSAGNTLGTWDNLAGVNDTTSSQSEWQATGLTPTFISTTSFSTVGNSTSTYTVNRRIQATNTGGTYYGYVYSATFGGALTTVVMVLDSGVLDSGLSTVNVGLLNATNPSVPQQYPQDSAPVSVTAASTTIIGATIGENVTITGSTTITAFDTISNGLQRTVTFTGAPLLTYNAVSMILPGGTSIQVAVGDTACFVSLGSGNWRCLWYQRASGASAVATPFPLIIMYDNFGGI